MLNQPIEAIIFDRDGTLLQIDFEGAARLSARCVDVAPQLPPAVLTQAFQGWPGPWPTSDAEEPAFWQRFWEALAPAHGLSAAQCLSLAGVASDYHSMFVAFPESLAVVEGLAARGLALAVLTNFELPSVDRTLSNAGIDPSFFAVRMASVSVGLRKPDPRTFLHVAQALQVDPARCLVVDDLPENCAGAEAAGMQAVLVDREGAFAGERYVRCASLHELHTMIS